MNDAWSWYMLTLLNFRFFKKKIVFVILVADHKSMLCFVLIETFNPIMSDARSWQMLTLLSFRFFFLKIYFVILVADHKSIL